MWDRVCLSWCHCQKDEGTGLVHLQSDCFALGSVLAVSVAVAVAVAVFVAVAELGLYGPEEFEAVCDAQDVIVPVTLDFGPETDPETVCGAEDAAAAVPVAVAAARAEVEDERLGD